MSIKCQCCTHTFANEQDMLCHYFKRHLGNATREHGEAKACWCGASYYTADGWAWHVGRRGGFYEHQAKSLFGVSIEGPK